MSIHSCAITLSVLLIVGAVSASAAQIRLPAGTVVTIAATQRYDSGNTTSGKVVVLSVVSDVQIDGVTVIKGGSGASGTIQDAREAQMLGQGGELSVAINNVQTVDGQSVSVTGSLNARGSDETTGTVVGAIFCPLFLLNQGDEATIAQGTQGRAITVSEAFITVP
jgi:hypothetical protein